MTRTFRAALALASASLVLACASPPRLGREPGFSGGLIASPIGLVMTDLDADRDRATTRAELTGGVDLLFAGADANGDGEASALEFADWAEAAMGSETAIPGRMAFDRDASGTVSRAEFAVGLDAEFARLDADGSGAIERSELVRMVAPGTGNVSRRGGINPSLNLSRANRDEPRTGVNEKGRLMRILGIDPGLRRCGWGVIDARVGRAGFVACGVITPDTEAPLSERLAAIHHGVAAVISEHAPEDAAIEDTFVNANALSALKLGHARAAAMLAASLKGLGVAEYAASLVKQSVTGKGSAEKEQVATMVRMLLPGSQATADAADALAVALCHAHHSQTRSRIAVGTIRASGYPQERPVQL